MVKEVQQTQGSSRIRWRYGMSAIGLGLIVFLALLAFNGAAAQGLAAPLQAAITIQKSSVTSIVETNNAVHQAVAGELVTVTVVYTVSGGTIYDASPRVVLQDGLYPIGSDPDGAAVYTGTTAANQLRNYEPLVARNGALVIFPDQGTITGTDAITMVVYAVRTQYQYVGNNEIGHNQNLRIQGVLRYCADAPGCLTTTAVQNDDTSAQVNTVQPALNVTYTPAPLYLDAEGLGAGGGQVRLTFNTANTGGRPYAHDIVYTATLGAGLTYHSSSSTEGAGAGTVTVEGDVTYITWQLPSRLGGQSWQGVVTATWPATFTIGQTFDYSARVGYETFAGDAPYEGKYTTSGAVQTLRPGVSITTKTSTPSSGAVTMGDRVTYTLTFRQAANTLLQAPYYVDTLPRGFHYVSGTLTVQGATMSSSEVLEGPSLGAGAAARYFENLRVNMDTLPLAGTARQVTVSYVALNTGLDYRGTPVWDSAADMGAARNSVEGNVVTGAMLNWTPPSGFTYGNLGGNYANLATKANSTRVDVIQPFLANAQFATYRTGVAPVTVGDSVLLNIRLRNSGGAPGIAAHELQVCDTIPDGFAYLTTFACNAVGGAPACPSYTEPAPGSTGKICWTLDGLPRTGAVGQFHELQYQVQVLPTAMPGVYSNAVTVEGYSSKAGVVEGERDYSEFSQALISGNCGAACITVIGLAGDKQSWTDVVVPGDLLTYTLWVTDTRNTSPYTGVVVTDTYDALLSFVEADPPATAHHEGARQLVWDLGALASGGAAQITLTMQVAPVVAGQYVLTNTMTWDSEQTVPFTIVETTGVAVPTLHVRMEGPESVHADEEIIYTVVYSNTGTAASSPVTLTLDYGPYVDFVSSSPLTPRAGSANAVFDDTLPGIGVNHTLTVNLRVKTPLPYDLAGPLTASALLESAGAESKQAGISMVLDRPVLVLEKIGPAVAPGLNVGVDYTIRVHNQGTYTATGAVITDTWGPYLNYRAAQNAAFGWTLSGDETYATQSIGELGIGQMATILFQLEVVDNSIFYMNTVNLTSDQTTEQEEVEYTWQRSIATTKTATPVTAFPGRALTYTIHYTSTSPDAMLNARITDTLPSGFVYQGHTAPQGGCQAAWGFTLPAGGGGGDAVWTCSALTANGSGHFLIWGEVKPEAEGTNMVNSTVTSADGTPVRPIDKPLVTRVARPWLRVDKTADPAHPVAPGDFITYILAYENYGTDSAYNVIIKDQLPAQVDYVSCSGGMSCNEVGGLVTWTIGDLAIDTGGAVQVVVQVTAGTAGQTAMNEDYTIEADILPVADTLTGDPVASVIFDPHITAEKAADPLFVIQTGDPITYTITMTNDGGGVLQNVVITDAIDLRTAVFQPSLPAGCTVSGQPGVDEVLTCNLGTMAQGAIEVVQFRVLMVGQPPVGTKITNIAYHNSDQTTPEPSNETTVWVTTGCIPPHNVDFTVSANPQAGQPVTFTASASGSTPMTFSWAFGDTQSGSGQVVQHTYAVSGTYKVELTANNDCVAPVTVSKNVFAPGAPEITWTPASFARSADEGSTIVLTDTLTVSNVGTDNLLWSIAVMTPTEATWLEIAVIAPPSTVILPGLSTAPGASTPVTLYLDPTDLTPGVYTAWLRIESNDADEGVVEIPVTFTVLAEPQIAVAPSALVYTRTVGAAAFTVPLFITNTGEVPLTWNLSGLTTWLGASPTTGSLNPTDSVAVTLTFTPTATVAVHTTVLTISGGDGGSTVDVPVTLYMVAAPVEDNFIYLPLVLRNHQ